MNPQTPKAKGPTTTVPSQRLPAPSLFIAPPSRNDPNLSTQSQAHDQTQNATTSSQSTHFSERTLSTSTTQQRHRARTNSSTPSLPDARRSSLAGRRPRPRPSRAQIDSQWADLQNTLQEIELTTSNGAQTHVFGASHAEALKELRESQIALAKVWGPGPEGNPSAAAAESEKEQGRRGSKDKVGGKAARKMSIGGEERGGQQDLTRAAERRQANAKYFAQVKQGVQHVVAKLDAVSVAMSRVEMESREIWGEGDSLASADTEGSEKS